MGRKFALVLPSPLEGEGSGEGEGKLKPCQINVP